MLKSRTAKWLRWCDISKRSERRLLLIASSFPPASDVGAARWEGFAGHLETLGWSLDVVMQDPASLFGLSDETRLTTLPQSLRVASITPEFPRWFKALSSLKRLLRRGDPRGALTTDVAPSAVRPQGFIRRVASSLTGRAFLTRERTFIRTAAEFAAGIPDAKYAAVITSGPPHTVHVAGRLVARRLGLPHITDLRDPWQQPSFSVGGESFSAASTIAEADAVIANTEAARDVLRAKFSGFKGEILSIPNGADVVSVPDGPGDGVFRIVHCGTLYLDRDPRPFLRAVEVLRARHRLDGETLKVCFMGRPARIEGIALEEWAARFGLKACFEQRDFGTRQDALTLIGSSAVGVLFQGENRTQIPAKLFDYVPFPVWILALVGQESATHEILRDTDAIVLDLDDEMGIAAALSDCFTRFVSGERPTPIGNSPRFSRKHQTEQLAALLERVTESSRTDRLKRAP
jgi:hypothetical protein